LFNIGLDLSHLLLKCDGNNERVLIKKMACELIIVSLVKYYIIPL